MKGLGKGKNVFNTTSLICSLAVKLIRTDEAFTVNGHTDTQTYARVRAASIYCLHEKITAVWNLTLARYDQSYDQILEKSLRKSLYSGLFSFCLVLLFCGRSYFHFFCLRQTDASKYKINWQLSSCFNFHVYFPQH